MPNITDTIKRLEDLKETHGDVDFKVWHAFSERLEDFELDKIHHDEEDDVIYIGVYN